jgi:Putative restriction endonuclease
MANDVTPSPTTSFNSLVLPGGVPELENGDRLTRAEFERRYAAMPDVTKAELIEGVVHMPSAVRVRRHGRPHAHLIHWMTSYSAETPGVEVADNSSNRLDLDNEVQPDGMLFILPECGGQARISQDDYVEGAAELLGEVAASSASHDLGMKLDVYRRNGVREYIVWRVLDRAIDWFVLREGSYEPLRAGSDGIYRSESLPGLWLDAAALVEGNLVRVASALRGGLATAEHRQFVELLAKRASAK